MASQERIEAIIDELRGTCLSLQSVMTEAEINDKEVCLAIDEELFECSQCEWWCEWSENTAEEGEPVCDGCA